MESQTRMVLAHLKAGKTLTPIDALTHYGSFRLSARIYDLKQAGWPIHCERTRTDSDKLIGVYSLNMNQDHWPNEL